ncbi:MAG: hypothetical protein IPQ07_08310 [Myxococcales bacterium]|nr:hypothetical protein [Myxococcales bacterium]
MHTTNLLTMLALSSAALTACGDDGGAANENEVITSVMLSFSPPTGTPVLAEFNDPDGDGGQAPTVQPVNLVANTSYAMTVRFQNRLATPAEEITEEVTQESDIHLLIFTGSAVVGPATSNATGPLTQAYADTDINGLPIGLSDTIMAKAGSGQLIVTLRHMPPEEPPQKAADTLSKVKAGGVDSIGGSTDAQVTFTVTVP